MAGSHVLVSVPRCVFNLQPASDEPTDHRIVWSCCKNNNGELGPRSAWLRSATDFSPLPEFDWEAFDKPPFSRPRNKSLIEIEHLRELFEEGERAIELQTAVSELQTITGCKKTACYNALSLKGSFSYQLPQDQEGLLHFTDHADLEND